MRKYSRNRYSERYAIRRPLSEAQIDLTDDEIWGRSDFDLRKANKRSQDAEKAKLKAQRDAEIFERNKQVAKKYFDIMHTQSASDAIGSLFKLLVPVEGKAETVAGEIIRAVSKIGYRWYNDGDVWLFYIGYDTCGKAVSYLMENCDSVNKFLIAWFNDWDEGSDSILYSYLYDENSFDEKYESKLEQLYEEVVKWLSNHPEAFTTANDNDMSQYDVYYDELTFSYDHTLDNDLIGLYDDGFITKDEIIEELFAWKYYNSEPYMELDEIYIDNATIEDIKDIREVMDDTDDGHTVYDDWIRENGNPYDDDDEEEDEDDDEYDSDNEDEE